MATSNRTLLVTAGLSLLCGAAASWAVLASTADVPPVPAARVAEAGTDDSARVLERLRQLEDRLAGVASSRDGRRAAAQLAPAPANSAPQAPVRDPRSQDQKLADHREQLAYQHESEVVDYDWAIGREAALVEAFAGLGERGLQLDDIQCRRESCRLQLTSRGEDPAVALLTLGDALGAGPVDIRPEGDDRFVAYVRP